jgi:hypothetical protein
VRAVVDEEVIEDLQDVVRDEVARGESDFDEVVEAALEYVEGEDDEELRAAARRLAIAEFAAHAEAQRSWGDGPLDPDRLNAAFEALDAAGIVARADFTCCQTCGRSEIGGEVPEGETRRGFTFCHGQDVDRALHGEGVYLTFGSFDADAATPADIAAEVVQALARHGFAPHWEGDVAKRIHVPMTWQVRRTGELAVYPRA